MKNFNFIKFSLSALALLTLSAGCHFSTPQQQTANVTAPQNTASSTVTNPPSSHNIATTTPPSASALVDPMSNARMRVTKKPFGIYITPATSPVQPEKFKGYHTGTDFETTPDEQNVDVPIVAICQGPLKEKKYATGYGGVAVQACVINNENVTVIYGHLRLSSIKPNVGEVLNPGDQIAVLGNGYSTETDGERKHLHLGIHVGSSINILGYVQNKKDLSKWIDPLTVIP